MIQQGAGSLPFLGEYKWLSRTKRRLQLANMIVYPSLKPLVFTSCHSVSACPSCHGFCTEMWLLKCGTSFVSSEQRVKDVWKEWFLLRYNQKNCSKYLQNCSSHKNNLKTNTYTSGNVVPWQSQTTTRCHHCATNTDSFFTAITLQPSPQRDYYGNCYWYCSTCAGLLSETSIPASSASLPPSLCPFPGS